MGGKQGCLKPLVLRKPFGGSTNPFPNLGLVSMGQDVDVRLQGAGFNDHLVPGVGWGGDTADWPGQSGDERWPRVIISLQAAVPGVSNGFNGPPAWVRTNTT